MPAISAGSDSAVSATDTNNGHQLADALQAYAHLCAESDRLLRGLGEQLNELGTATEPIAARALTLVAAEGNITRSRDAVEELMINVNASRKVGEHAYVGCLHGPWAGDACALRMQWRS